MYLNSIQTNNDSVVCGVITNGQVMKIRLDLIQSGDPYVYYDVANDEEALDKAEQLNSELEKEEPYYAGCIIYEIEQDDMGDIIKREIE